MGAADLIEQELAVAEAAWKFGNEGKARVCARRAVALATEAWLARRSVGPWRGDAMAYLRRIQQDGSCHHACCSSPANRPVEISISPRWRLR